MNNNNKPNKCTNYETMENNVKVELWRAYTYDHLEHVITKGNKKIGKNVFHASSAPGTADRGGTCFCNCNGCYGCSGCYNYSNVKGNLLAKADIIRTDLDRYTDMLKKDLTSNINYLRIHATGDFCSKEYAATWLEIIKEHLTTTFWTYTKAHGHGFDDILEEMNTLPNMNIVESVVPSYGFNFGHCSYILGVYDYLREAGETPYICPCGTPFEKHCGDCLGCSSHKYVLFIEHGTAYKAEHDPNYGKILEIVKSEMK